jgi:4-oxalocrotonate tautomerase
VQEVDLSRWFIGNKSLDEHGLASFWLDVRIVDGTNPREEKAEFIATTFTAMEDLISPLHGESYIHVDDVRGDAYGYEGITQNERYFFSRKSTSAKTLA